MADSHRVVTRLKSHARVLERAAALGVAPALARLRALPELRPLDNAELAATVRRRHCLAVIARALGFAGWPELAADLDGAANGEFGTLLYPPGSAAFWNVWSAAYDEARAIRAEHGGYLLAYRRHFFIAEDHFVANLGLDPDDPDWTAIGRDWVRPADPAARQRLYAALVDRQLARWQLPAAGGPLPPC
jgi:hypothetical protein